MNNNSYLSPKSIFSPIKNPNPIEQNPCRFGMSKNDNKNIQTWCCFQCTKQYRFGSTVSLVIAVDVAASTIHPMGI